MMTSEEAIKQLKKCKSFHNGSYGAAINLAIKALEQIELNPSYNSIKTELKPCEDCISRQAIKEMLNEEWTKYMPMELDINLSFVMEKINELPSVIPKTRWIPVSERLPEHKGDYLVTFKLLFTYPVEVCYFDGQAWDKGQYDAVLAWMPLPKPYNAESEE